MLEIYFICYHKNHSEGYGKYDLKRFRGKKTGNTRYYNAANAQQQEVQSNNTVTLEDGLERLQEEHLLTG